MRPERSLWVLILLLLLKAWEETQGGLRQPHPAEASWILAPPVPPAAALTGVPPSGREEISFRPA